MKLPDKLLSMPFPVWAKQSRPNWWTWVRWAEAESVTGKEPGVSKIVSKFSSRLIWIHDYSHIHILRDQTVLASLRLVQPGRIESTQVRHTLMTAKGIQWIYSFLGTWKNKQLCGVTENIALPMLRSVCEVDCVDTEIEQNVFKVPQKRKKCDKSQDAKASRKNPDLQGSEDQETESDSKLSDSLRVIFLVEDTMMRI